MFNRGVESWNAREKGITHRDGTANAAEVPGTIRVKHHYKNLHASQ